MPDVSYKPSPCSTFLRLENTLSSLLRARGNFGHVRGQRVSCLLLWRRRGRQGVYKVEVMRGRDEEGNRMAGELAPFARRAGEEQEEGTK